MFRVGTMMTAALLLCGMTACGDGDGRGVPPSPPGEATSTPNGASSIGGGAEIRGQTFSGRIIIGVNPAGGNAPTLAISLGSEGR